MACEEQKATDADKWAQVLLFVGASENEFIIPFVAGCFSTI